MAYTNKYDLPDDSQNREILICRHASVRRSLRAASFRQPVSFFILFIFYFIYSVHYSHLRDLHSPSSSSSSLHSTSPGLRSTSPCSRGRPSVHRVAVRT